MINKRVIREGKNKFFVEYRRAISINSIAELLFLVVPFVILTLGTGIFILKIKRYKVPGVWYRYHLIFTSLSDANSFLP